MGDGQCFIREYEKLYGRLPKIGFQLNQNECTLSELNSFNPNRGNGTTVRDAILYRLQILETMVILKNCKQLALTDVKDNRQDIKSKFELNFKQGQTNLQTLAIRTDMNRKQLPYIQIIVNIIIFEIQKIYLIEFLLVQVYIVSFKISFD